MRLEFTMRLLFGEKAYQIASLEANPVHRREWLQKAIRKLLRRQVLMGELEAISKALKGTKVANWELSST